MQTQNELWEDTKGQPWLVNAMGYELTWKDKTARDLTKDITPEDYKAGRERLIQSRQTHLGQLTDKLREARVHKVISTLLSTEDSQLHIERDALDYVEDLGLIRTRPYVQITNQGLTPFFYSRRFSSGIK